MRRRDFLLCSSAGLLSPLVASATPDLFGGPQTYNRYPIGYWNRYESEGLVAPVLFSSASVTAGDEVFMETGARISIRGNIPLSTSSLESLDVDVDFRPFHDNTFAAWHWDSRSARQGGAPTRLTVPVHGECGLNLLIRSVGKSDSAQLPSREVPLHLSLGREPGEAKLKRGVYCIFLENAFDEAGIDREQYRLVEMRNALLLQQRDSQIADWKPAASPYLTVSVEYAQPDPVRVLA